jgi:hypothetical protein
VAKAVVLSVTRTVKLLVPAGLGVPDIVPFGARFSPAGSVPLVTDHEYGGVPPDAASVCEYAVATVPAGSDDVVISNAAGLIVTDSGAMAEPDALSVTRTVKLLGPAVPGVPDIVPLGARFSPAGSVPLATDHKYGGVPPEAVSPCEYAVPTVPAGSDDVVISKADGLTVSDSAAVALEFPLSTTVTVKPVVPGAAGMPLMTPVAAARPKAGGNVPADIVQVTGGTPPDTERVAEYGEPAVPFGNAVVVITGMEVTLIRRVCVSVPSAESRTLAVNRNVPLFCGVPLMVPPLSRVSPAGGAPADTDQV